MEDGSIPEFMIELHAPTFGFVMVDTYLFEEGFIRFQQVHGASAGQARQPGFGEIQGIQTADQRPDLARQPAAFRSQEATIPVVFLFEDPA